MPWGGVSNRHGRRGAFEFRPSSEEAVSEIFQKSRFNWCAVYTRKLSVGEEQEFNLPACPAGSG
jgi:hypothetical protein